MPQLQFSEGFVWGAATAAYQIEGAVREDGRGESIWDRFSHTPGKTRDGATGDVACDHYHRWKEDVALLQGLGVGAYRLSLSWPRIQPDGTGRPNARGLAFYDRLIDRLLAAGVTPWVTLYHWDLPQALQQRGGFLNRDLMEWFGDFAARVAERLGDRVGHWMTFNEPPVVLGLGHLDGKFAPGLRLPFSDCLLGAHHLLLAHGRAVQALRAGCRRRVRIALAHTARERIPASAAAADIEAARRDTFASTERHFMNLAWWADPMYLGHYPEDGVAAYGRDMPRVTDADLRLIAQPTDFIAYNCYSGWPVRAGKSGAPEAVPGGWGPGNARGTLPWLEMAPDAAYWAPRFQCERYRLPFVFTENGFANTDFVHLDGTVPDPQRIDFTRRYLRAMRRAVAEGIPVEGYFHWSLLDNFEWAEGFKDRFGLVHVDFRTLARTPKQSYHWYREVIRTRGANL
jgi:beta-glucosidase